MIHKILLTEVMSTF